MNEERAVREARRRIGSRRCWSMPETMVIQGMLGYSSVERGRMRSAATEMHGMVGGWEWEG